MGTPPVAQDAFTRTQNRSTEAPAQESGPGDLPTFKLREEILLASLNIRGIRSAVKRRDITLFMTRNRIDIMTIQETHNGDNTRDKGKKHSIYFSGGTQEGAIHHGVGTIIKIEHRNSIKYVEPMNARMMIMTLRGKVPIYIFSIYAPTAEADSETKDNFH